MKETNKQRKKIAPQTPPTVEEVKLYDFYFGKLLMYTIAGLLLLTIGLTV